MHTPRVDPVIITRGEGDRGRRKVWGWIHTALIQVALFILSGHGPMTTGMFLSGKVGALPLVSPTPQPPIAGGLWGRDKKGHGQYGMGNVEKELDGLSSPLVPSQPWWPGLGGSQVRKRSALGGIIIFYFSRAVKG